MAATQAGPATGCARWEHLATGIRLADENRRRLDEIRARYDPDRRFHSWMTTAPR